MGLGSGIRDPGSGKNLFRIPDLGPEVKKAPDPGSATLLDSNSIPGIDFYPLNPSKNLASGRRKGKRKGIERYLQAVGAERISGGGGASWSQMKVIHQRA
jgi:hypothetical protein